MQDAVGAAPFWQHSDECAGCERLPTISGWQQRNPRALACGRDQNVKATAREARFDRYAAGFTAFGGQMPNAAALFFLMQDGEVGKVGRRRRNARFCQQVRARDKDASRHADPLHLQVGVGVEAFANADRDIDPFVN